MSRLQYQLLERYIVSGSRIGNPQLAPPLEMNEIDQFHQHNPEHRLHPDFIFYLTNISSETICSYYRTTIHLKEKKDVLILKYISPERIHDAALQHTPRNDDRKVKSDETHVTRFVRFRNAYKEHKRAQHNQSEEEAPKFADDDYDSLDMEAAQAGFIENWKRTQKRNALLIGVQGCSYDDHLITDMTSRYYGKVVMEEVDAAIQPYIPQNVGEWLLKIDKRHCK